MGYLDATEDVLGGAPPPWEPAEGDPVGVADPLLPGMLEARSAAARVFLDALGLPHTRRRADRLRPLPGSAMMPHLRPHGRPGYEGGMS